MTLDHDSSRGEMGTTVKCLVWDLDETLWRGTLLEGDDVVLADQVVEILRALDQRGVLHSIASRNDHDRAWARLTALGVADYFLHPQIGWGRKPDAVRAIAERFNFALDAVAFVDDSPAERAEMTYYLPQVRCYPAALVPDLAALPEFTPEVVTEDARRRRQSYRAAERREASRAAFAGPAEEFLRSLHMVLRIAPAGEADLPRVTELTQRTSQMNATGVPYSHDALKQLRQDPGHAVLTVTLEDRFGPYGAIGVVLVERHPRAWHLKLLATSCRVVSFGVGSVLLRWLTNEAAGAGVHLVADFRATGRNRIMEIAYRFAGFVETPECCCQRQLPALAVDGIIWLHLYPSPACPIETVCIVADPGGLWTTKPS
jgi:methoxymalonate biosynthesis protein